VDVIEPYEGCSNVARIRRLPLETVDGQPYADNCVAIEIQLSDGRRDLLVSADVEDPLGLTPSLSQDSRLAQKEWRLVTDAELCWLRLNAAGEVERVALCRGSEVRVKDVVLRLKKPTDFVEIRFDAGVPSLVSGNPDDVLEILLAGSNVWQR